mgnify:CR=1 FL=1
MAVAPIVETGAKIVLKGLEIFSDERRRALEKDYHEILSEVDAATNAQYPDYSDSRKALAVQHRETFEIAYNREFGARIDAIKPALRTAGLLE